MTAEVAGDEKNPVITSYSVIGYEGIDIAASWRLEDKPFIRDLIKKCRSDPKLAKSFYDAQFYAARFGWHSHSPQAIGLAINKMTDNGIQRHGELVCMKTSKLFTYFAIGTGSSPTTSQSSALDAEIGRSYMDSDDGFRVSAGSDIIECGYFDETYPSFTASESGCFDGDGTDPNSEIMEWRAVYPTSQQIAHTQNVNFMTYIHTIVMRAI